MDLKVKIGISMFEIPVTIERIAEITGGQFQGDGSVEISGLAALDESAPGMVTFAADAKNLTKVRDITAAAIIVPEDADCETDAVLIKVKNVHLAIAQLLGAIDAGEDVPEPGIHPTAYIAPGVTLGDNVAVGAHVTIEAGASIGDGTALCPNVYIGNDSSVGADTVLAQGVVIRRRCTVGSRVRIGPNSVIGHDGFGYVTVDGVHHKVPHAGNTVIEDDVELGACCCIDRAKWGSTLVKSGCKMDNLVQIAHNVEVGSGSLIAALAGVAGSAELGDYVVLGGHAGVRDNISIGKGTMLGACSCLAASAGPGELLLGSPAKDGKTKIREFSAVNKLPDLMKRVRRLEKEIARISSDQVTDEGDSQ